MPPIVRLKDVAKSYRLGGRDVLALRGVNLEITTPGFWGIMGPSGSGKTTLLHLIAALDRPDRGEIEIGGTRIDQLNEKALTAFRRRRLGIVFQQFNLIASMTALQNVELPALLDGVDRTTRRTRAMALLEEFGLSDRAEHRPDALSGGEQQRVAMARALMFEPDVLLADEPTGSLDSESSERIWSRLATLGHERGTTVLMVTHEPAAIAHCDGIVHLHDGRTLEERPVSPSLA